MTKKKRDAEDISLPTFDEVGFMRTEISGARAAIFAVVWAVPAALVGYGLTLVHPALAAVGFLAGLVMLYGMKWLFPLVRVDPSTFKRRDWIGHGSTFFFSWIAFWILLLNPPFADLTAPSILGITVDGAPVSCGGSVVASSTTTALNVSASDNVGVASVTYTRGLSDPNPMGRAGDTLWTATFPRPASNVGVTVAVTDLSGHTASCGFTIAVPP